MESFNITLILIIGSIFIILYLGFLCIQNITQAERCPVDTIIYRESLLNTLNGCLLCNRIEGHFFSPVSIASSSNYISHIAIHNQFVLLLFIPFALIHRILPLEISLTILQIIILYGIGSLLLFRYFLDENMDKNTSLLCALLFLFNPQLFLISQEYHPIVFSIPLIILFIMSVKHSTYITIILTSIFLTLIREDLNFTLVLLGVYIFFWGSNTWSNVNMRKARISGLVLSLSAVFSYLVYNNYLVNLFAPYKLNPWNRFEPFGSSLSQIMITVFSQPLFTMEQLPWLDISKWLIAILLPLGFLPLIRPHLIPLAVNSWALVLFSRFSEDMLPDARYHIPLLCLLFITMPIAINTIKNKATVLKYIKIYLIILLIFNFTFVILFDYWEFVQHGYIVSANFAKRPNHEFHIIKDKYLLDSLEGEIIVSSFYLRHFRNAYPLHEGILDYVREPDVILIDKDTSWLANAGY